MKAPNFFLFNKPKIEDGKVAVAVFLVNAYCLLLNYVAEELVRKRGFYFANLHPAIHDRVVAEIIVRHKGYYARNLGYGGNVREYFFKSLAVWYAKLHIHAVVVHPVKVRVNAY